MTLPEGHPADGSKAELFSVFVSYARTDSRSADALADRLQSQGMAVRIDRRSLPYGEEWQLELTEMIAEADAIVWLVSPASVASQWCGWELAEVARLSKRLVPLRIAPVDAHTIPGQLGRIHFLPAEGTFSLDEHLPILIAALSAHRPWVKAHTRLGERARAWADAGRPDNELLLSGRELEEAEVWLAGAPSAALGLLPAPRPSELHRNFLTASRAAEEAARRERTMREQAARIAVGYQFSSRAQLAVEGACFDRALRLALAGICLSRPDTPRALYEDLVDAARRSRLIMEARPEAPLSTVALTPDLSRAAVVTQDGDLAVWDVESARVVARLEGRGRDGVLSTAIDSRGTRIVVARNLEYADVVDARTGALLRTLGPHAGRAALAGLVEGTPLAFTTDKPNQIFAGRKQYFALHLWNIETGERLYTIDDFSGPVESVQIHPDRTTFVTSSLRDYRVWDIATGNPVRSLGAHVMSFSPDGQRYLTEVPKIRGIGIRDWSSDAVIAQLEGSPVPIDCACWSPDSTRVAAGHSLGAVSLWDAATGKPQHWLLDESHGPDAIATLRFTRDGEGLIVATDGASMSVWNLQHRRIAAALHGHESRILDMELSADGRSLWSASREALRVWTLADSPHASPRSVGVARPSIAGLRPQRPQFLKLNTSFGLNMIPGTRIFGPVEESTVLHALLARGLADAETFTDLERREDRLVEEAPLNPFAILRDSRPDTE